MKRASTIALALLILAAVAHPHGLRHSVSNQGAVVVTITHEDGVPFSDQHYQVYHGDDAVAFQTGRTDALGRVVFLPNQGGMWRVRAFSEDGHGIDVDVEAGNENDGAPVTNGTAPLDQRSRLVIGLALLFGVFGVVMLFYRRRS